MRKPRSSTCAANLPKPASPPSGTCLLVATSPAAVRWSVARSTTCCRTGSTMARSTIRGRSIPGQHEAIVDEALWNKVQAVRADNRVERAVRSDAASPSLLAGLLWDEDGIRLTSTHAKKKGRRYRYYVSHDLIAGRKGPADADSSESLRRRNSARRILANDLEAIVEERIIQFLGDATAIDGIGAPQARDVEERRHLVDCAGELAANWHSLPPTERVIILQRLVKAIVVTATTVEISLRAEAVTAIARHPVERIAANDGMTHRMNSEDEGEIITLSVTSDAEAGGDGDASSGRSARRPSATRARSQLGAHPGASASVPRSDLARRAENPRRRERDWNGLLLPRRPPRLPGPRYHRRDSRRTTANHPLGQETGGDAASLSNMEGAAA